MRTSYTVDELVEKLFGEACLQSFDEVSISSDSPNKDHAVTLDELSNSYLGKSVESAFPDVDLKEERIGIEFTARELHLRIGMQGLSLILTIIFIAALILGSSVAISILQTVFRS